jgi:hypothetical protein
MQMATLPCYTHSPNRCMASRCIASAVPPATLLKVLTLAPFSPCAEQFASRGLLRFARTPELCRATTAEGWAEGSPRGGLGWRSLEQGVLADSAPLSCNTFAGADRSELRCQAHTHHAANGAGGERRRRKWLGGAESYAYCLGCMRFLPTSSSCE